MITHRRWLGCGARGLGALAAVLVLASSSYGVIINEANTGRFLRVQNNGLPNRTLHIGELEAYLLGYTPTFGALDNSLNNVALPANGASFESQVGSGGHGAESAVFDGAAQSGGATWSRDNAGEFVLDLGTNRALGTARVWQRVDCCYDRLRDFTVSLLADIGGLPGPEVASRTFSAQPLGNSYGQVDLSDRVFRPGNVGAIGTEVLATGTNGRFIQVMNNGAADRLLHIGEIEAFQPGVVPAAGLDQANDLALAHKGASFESQVGGGGHGAVEAVIDGQLQTGANTWTRQAVGAAYVLDLGETRTLDTVRVWQRTDFCCQERLSDFTVSLLADNGAGLPGSVVASQSFPGQAPTNSFASVSLGTANQYRLGQGDRLAMEINAAAGTADKVSVGAAGDGALRIDPGAKLQVSVLAGTPAKGQSFDLIDAGSITGKFSKSELPALTGSLFWNTSKLYTTGELQVTENILTEVGAVGRFVRVRNNGAVSRQLHIGEIEAFLTGVVPAAGLDNTNDMALASKGASFESMVGPLQHGTVGAVFDGALQVGADTFSLNPGVGNEYVLDLGQTRNLGNVRVWQRADGCCQERLSDFTVSILADNGAGAPGAEVASVGFPGQAPTNSFASLDMPIALHPGGVGAIGTGMKEAEKARFIRVKNNGAANREMHIGEIEAFAEGTAPSAGLDAFNDLALASKGASFESSTGVPGHGAEAAVFDGALQTGANTWDRAGVGVEYVLDLGQKYDLGQVRVWQRADGCCQDRLSDFTVSLLADNGAGLPGSVLYSQSYPGIAPTNSYAAFSVNVPDAFTLTSIHTLAIELDGNTNTSDVLMIGADGQGILNIDPGATLNVSLIAGSLNGEPVFNILDFGTVNGTFTTINLPPLRAAQSWDLSQLYLTGQIALHVPEPSTWLLAALGGVLLAGCARVRRKGHSPI